MMVGMTNSSKDYDGFCYGYLIHVIWRAWYYCCCITATYLLILLTTITTSICQVAIETNYFSSSNVNNNVFSYYNVLVDFHLYQKHFQMYQKSFLIRNIIALSYNNKFLLEALSRQGRLHGHPFVIYLFDMLLPLLHSLLPPLLCHICEWAPHKNQWEHPFLLPLHRHIQQDATRLEHMEVVWIANVGNHFGDNAYIHLRPNNNNLELVD